MSAELPDGPLEQLRAVDSHVRLHAVATAAARRLAGADGATFVLREGDNCFYAAEDAIAPLWRGQRFPMTHCISGWAMLHDEVALVPNINLDERIPLEAYRPTFVRSLAMVPVGSPSAGALGVYWAQIGHEPNATTVGLLSELARQVGAAVARLGLEGAPWAPNFALRDERSA